MEKIKLIDLKSHRYVVKLNKGELVNRCKNCVFFDEDCDGNCTMNAPNTLITKVEKEALLAHCIGENRYYECVSCADDDITINGDKYYFVKSLGISYMELSCTGCAFINNDGGCKLFDYKSQNKIDKTIYEKCRNKEDNYIWIAASKVDLIKPQDIRKESMIKFDEEDAQSISSTGVVDSSTDAALKEPSNNAPSVTNKNVKRHIDVVLTLDEARGWYNGPNIILKNLAARAFTLDELEDVRTCSCPIDIKTAKRLYRNAENVVRQFVLSAFTEDELKD